MSLFVCVCMYVRMYVPLDVCMFVRVYVCMYARVSIHVFIYALEYV